MRHSTRFLNIHGVSLYAAFLEPEDASQALYPTIVFLHDSLGCTDLWRDFPQKIAEQTHCPVLIYDRQGYGRSDAFGPEARTQRYMETEAEILGEILKSLGLEQVILFGHSDGGSIALMAAAKFPAVIKGIITEGAHVFVEDITLQGIRTAVSLYATTNLKEKLSRYHGEKTEAVFHAWANTWLKPEYRSWNIEHFLPQVLCPSLIIQGVNDEYGSEKQVNAIVGSVKGPSLKYMVNGAAHTPHKESSQDTLDKTLTFIHSLL
ncbi:MAG: alpha/beta hydrolase [Bacteroidetes bacterium]|nr:alpha/beta hydrolase [Bacteroidota bacterium]